MGLVFDKKVRSEMKVNKFYLFIIQVQKLKIRWQYLITIQRNQISQFKLQYFSTMSAHPHPEHTPVRNNQVFYKQNSKNSNVRVVCRIKPLNNSEEPIDMKIDKETGEISIIQLRQETTKTFTFNRIYTDESQKQFVSQVCKQVLNRAIIHNQGSLIFSYGVTNSGKTHTILGSQSEPGILPYLVTRLSQHGQVYLSGIQLYNDEFFSLANKEKLLPRQQGGFMDFQHCSISEPVSIDNLDMKFKQYLNNRTQNDNKLNSKSSRSHAIFRIKLGNVNIGVVDLAGSQRTNKVFNTIDQTSNINKSLLCLGRCIKALNQNPQSHLPIPYRQSKLTKVLIEYFSSKIEVLMIANINQSQACFHQNMKVLDYAVLAKDIRHCATDHSIKKSQYKPNKTNKVDIFDLLHQSASKPAFHTKSLKSSRSKMNQKVPKNILKNTDAKKNFAKTLKAQQLQLYIEKFDSSQQTFEYMVDYMHQQQIQNDNQQIQAIKIYQYQSPYPIANKKQEEVLQKQYKEVGVGRSEHSVEKIKKQLQDHMKDQLKILIEGQRMAKMMNKQTMVGDSLSKNHSKFSSQQQISLTPQKLKECPPQNIVMKTSNAIYSSVKKILKDKAFSIKKMFKMNKSPIKNQESARNQKMSICNYGSMYESLFKVDRLNDERYSQISFYEKINEPKKQTKDIQTQTQFQIHYEANKGNKDQSTQQTGGQTGVQTDDQYPTLQIYSKQVETSIRKSKDFVNESQNISINEADDEQSLSQSQNQKNKANQSNKKPKKNKKNNKAKENPNGNQAAKRVAEIRKYAARLCRQHSRTPLKMRLRSRKPN